MSYAHVAVKDIVQESDISEESVASMVKSARESGWSCWLDDIPVTPQLQQLGERLRKVLPGFKFYPNRNKWVRDTPTSPEVLVASDVFVLMEASAYAVMRIGYRQYTRTGQAYQYAVFSRLINNTRYYSNSLRRHAKLTESIDIAVKNALAYAVPYSAAELAEITYRGYHKLSTGVGQQKMSVLSSLVEAASGFNVVMNEVRALRASGVSFTTPEFIALANEMDYAVQLANSERNKRVDAFLVRFIQHSWSGVQAEVAQATNIRGNPDPDILDQVTTYSLEDLPPEISEKVAVLQTLDAGQHVDGVGMKFDEKVFWVEK